MFSVLFYNDWKFILLWSEHISSICDGYPLLLIWLDQDVIFFHLCPTQSRNCMLFSTAVAPSCTLTNKVADTVRGAALGALWGYSHRLNWRQNTHSECGQHHSMGRGPQVNKMGQSRKWARCRHYSLLSVDTMWSVSCLMLLAPQLERASLTAVPFSTVTDCPLKLCAQTNPFFLTMPFSGVSHSNKITN